MNEYQSIPAPIGIKFRFEPELSRTFRGTHLSAATFWGWSFLSPTPIFDAGLGFAHGTEKWALSLRAEAVIQGLLANVPAQSSIFDQNALGARGRFSIHPHSAVQLVFDFLWLGWIHTDQDVGFSNREGIVTRLRSRNLYRPAAALKWNLHPAFSLQADFNLFFPQRSTIHSSEIRLDLNSNVAIFKPQLTAAWNGTRFGIKVFSSFLVGVADLEEAVYRVPLWNEDALGGKIAVGTELTCRF